MTKPGGTRKRGATGSFGEGPGRSAGVPPLTRAPDSNQSVRTTRGTPIPKLMRRFLRMADPDFENQALAGRVPADRIRLLDVYLFYSRPVQGNAMISLDQPSRTFGR